MGGRPRTGDQVGYSAGKFEVRPEERRVLLNGEALALGARAFDLLMALVERRERVVGKEELMAVVWPGLNVEENNLTVQISAVRKALGAGAIATVAGHGYRFTLPLNEHRPPADGAPRRSHNLPAERSSFIGREPQIAALRQLLSARRLVTLTGIGGAGKTRLALRVAALELPRFRDGVFLVDLAPVSDAQFVVQTAAQACGVLAGDSPPGAGRSLIDRLVSALAARQCLIVVDNCEHVLDDCAELIDALISGCCELVALLVAKSLVATSADDVGATRYRLLETVRLYAGEKLAAAGETAAVRARYRDAWIAWLEAMPLERLMLDVDAIAAVAREIDHLRAAAASCLIDDRPDLLARLASPLVGFCLTGNWYRTALGFLEQALAVPERLSASERVACHAALRAREQFLVPAFAGQAMAAGWTVELAPALYAGGRRDLADAVLCHGALAMRRNGVDLAPNQFLCVAGVIEYLRGEPARSARLMGAARSLDGADRQVMAFRTPAAMAYYRYYLPLVRRELGAEAARRLRDEGRAMRLDEAFEYALEALPATW
jgi:DNA-binding winged helix-turn-helix (wHTH) protein